MISSCPHCKKQMDISNNRLDESWSFAQCSNCGGFSLFRKKQVEKPIIIASARRKKTIAPPPFTHKVKQEIPIKPKAPRLPDPLPEPSDFWLTVRNLMPIAALSLTFVFLGYGIKKYSKNQLLEPQQATSNQQSENIKNEKPSQSSAQIKSLDSLKAKSHFDTKQDNDQ